MKKECVRKQSQQDGGLSKNLTRRRPEKEET